MYAIREGDPLSASVRFHATSGMARGDWSMRYEGAARIFARTWTHRFPRDHV